MYTVHIRHKNSEVAPFPSSAVCCGLPNCAVGMLREEKVTMPGTGRHNQKLKKI